MADLASYAGGIYKSGDEPEEFADSMSEIASAISKDLDLANVVITDGVTEMSHVQTDALVGTAGDFTYTKSYSLTLSGENYTYKIGETSYTVPTASVPSSTTEDGEYDGHRIFSRTSSEGANVWYIEYEWEDPAEAELTETNNVVWDTSSETLEDSVLYRVLFTVWPKQEAYDLIADLSNQTQKVTDLPADQKVQLRVAIGGTVYEYANGSWNGKTDAELNALIEADPSKVVFSMKTNTGLSATYTYGGQQGSQSYTNYTNGDMSLEEITISVEKLWHNYLDSRTDDDIDGIQMVLSRDGEDYFEFDVSEDSDWKKDDIYISCGVISDGVVKETGRDYYVTEKAPEGAGEAGTVEDKTTYWDVDSPVYHPMVVNGVVVMFLETEDASESEFSVTRDGKTHYYKRQTGSTTMTAINERKSWLNLIKAVDSNGWETDPDQLFEYEVTITTPKEDEEVFFSVRGGGENYRNDIETDATGWQDATTGNYYYYFTSGSTVSIKVKAGWSTRFLNLVAGTEYTITEVNLPSGYVLDSSESVETLYVDRIPNPDSPGRYISVPGDGYPITTTFDDVTVTGTINQANTDYTVNYTNKFLGYFFVYHSSDCTVERFPAATDGEAYHAAQGDVKAKTFDIVALNATGTLYGGYYSDYAGKSDDFDATELDYSGESNPHDEGGSDYDYAYIKSSSKAAWDGDDAYETQGNAMVPTAGTVYYLKEVPTGYLQPYLHYTYYVVDGEIPNAWLISDIDDNNYTETGFVIITDDKVASVVSSLTVETKRGGSSIKLTPKRVYSPMGVLDGYLTFYEVISNNTGKEPELANGDLVAQYWVTPDSMIVTGTTTRTYKGLENKNDIGVNEVDETAYSVTPRTAASGD